MQEDKNQPLPPELDWNNMREGIYKKIESLESEYAPEKQGRLSKIKKRLIFVLLLVLMLSLFFAYQSTSKYEAAEDSSLVQSLEVDEVIQRLGNTEEIAKKNARTNNTPRATKSSEYSSRKKGSSFIKSLVTAREFQHDVNTLENFDQTSIQPALVSSIPTKNFSVEEANKSEDTSVDPRGTTTPAINMGLSSNAHITGIKLLPSYKLDQIPIAKEYPLAQINLQKAVSTSQKKDLIPNQLILEGGLTFWSKGYGTDIPESAAYEQLQASFQLQVNYKKSWPSNYFTMAGLQYQQLESRFEYNTTIQDYPIVLSDTIVQIRNNILTGEQTIIRGDVEQFVEAERRIVHHNTTSILSGSFAMGKNWQLKAFQADIYLGGALNGVVHNQGKTLSQGTIIEYDGVANPSLGNRWTVAGIVGGRFHYSLNQQISLTAAMQVQKSLLNWGLQDEPRFYPTTVSLLFGVGYSL